MAINLAAGRAGDSDLAVLVAAGRPTDERRPAGASGASGAFGKLSGRSGAVQDRPRHRPGQVRVAAMPLILRQEGGKVDP